LEENTQKNQKGKTEVSRSKKRPPRGLGSTHNSPRIEIRKRSFGGKTKANGTRFCQKGKMMGKKGREKKRRGSGNGCAKRNDRKVETGAASVK